MVLRDGRRLGFVEEGSGQEGVVSKGALESRGATPAPALGQLLVLARLGHGVPCGQQKGLSAPPGSTWPELRAAGVQPYRVRPTQPAAAPAEGRPQRGASMSPATPRRNVKMSVMQRESAGRGSGAVAGMFPVSSDGRGEQRKRTRGPSGCEMESALGEPAVRQPEDTTP